MIRPVKAIRTLLLLFVCAVSARAYATDISFTLSGTSPYCSGQTVTLHYDGTGTTFNAGNLFSAQLSDEFGSFTSAVQIGSLTSTNATGSFNVTFPGPALGTGYRIRIVSNNPSIVGTAGPAFTITTAATPSISITADPPTTVGAGSVIYFSSTIVGGGVTPTIQWKKNGGNVATGNAFVLTSAAVGDQVEATLTSSLACATPATANSNLVTITVDNNLTKTNHAWEPRAMQVVSSVVVDRANAAGFTIGTKAYIGTGGTPANQYRKDFWEYDPATDTWTQKANLGEPATSTAPGRINAVGFSISTKGYIGMGNTAIGVVKDFYEYNPINNQWLVRTAFPGAAREQAFGFGITTNMRGYVGGGVASGTDFQDFYEFNPTSNDWVSKPDFAGGKRLGSATFTVDAEGYVVGGYSASTNTYYNDLWSFNGTSWAQLASMPGNGRTRATAFSLAGNGYAGLGYSASGYEGQFYQYNVAANTWLQKPYYPGPTTPTFGVGLAVGNHAYVYKDGTMFEYNLFTTQSFPSKMCTTESIAVNYDVSGFTFGANNFFTAQISPSPAFSVSTTLATKSSQSPSGTINVTIPTSANGTYYFRVTSSNPPLTTLLETITVTNLPSSHSIAPETGNTVCVGTSVKFTSNLSGTGFQWYKNDVAIGSDSPEYIAGDLANADVVKAVRTYTAGCKAPVGVTSNAVAMTVRTPAKPTVTVTQPNTLVSTTATAYQWFKDGNSISKATNQTYQMTETGVYKVRITDSGGCTAFSDDMPNVYTGLGEDLYNSEIVAYPSPFNNEVYISIADYIVTQGCEFTLFNELGQTVIAKQRADRINKFDLSGRAPGLYILRVSFGDNTIVRKVFKKD